MDHSLLCANNLIHVPTPRLFDDPAHTRERAPLVIEGTRGTRAVSVTLVQLPLRRGIRRGIRTGPAPLALRLAVPQRPRVALHLASARRGDVGPPAARPEPAVVGRYPFPVRRGIRRGVLGGSEPAVRGVVVRRGCAVAGPRLRPARTLRPSPSSRPPVEAPRPPRSSSESESEARSDATSDATSDPASDEPVSDTADDEYPLELAYPSPKGAPCSASSSPLGSALPPFGDTWPP